MSDIFVAVLMGSDSDLPQMQPAIDTLKKFGLRVEVKVTSAHRTPAATHAYVTDADQRGCGVFIAAAGMAAQILATADPSLAELVKAERAESAKAVQAKDAALQAKLNQSAS